MCVAHLEGEVCRAIFCVSETIDEREGERKNERERDIERLKERASKLIPPTPAVAD